MARENGDEIWEQEDIVEPPEPLTRRNKRHPFLAGALTMGLVVIPGGIVADRRWNEGRLYQAAGNFIDEQLPVTGSHEASSPEADGRATASPEAAPTTAPTDCIAELPLDTRIGQLLFVGVRGDEMVQNASVFADHAIGGAIIMTSPADPHDGSIEAFKNTTEIPLLIATDEEGGTREEGGVQRFRNLGALPLAEKAAATMSADELAAAVQSHGEALRDVGIDMVFGPVADVNPVQGEGPLPGRIYSDDPEVVAEFAGATVAGWRAAGILPTLKHFPGLGGGTENTDYNTSVTPPLDELRGHDLIPYEALADSGAAVMVGNQVVPELTDGQPASLSRPAFELLRSELGYSDALVVTDSLSAAAISDIPQAVTQAIAAGADMALVVSAPQDQTMEALVDASLDSVTEAVTAGTIKEAEINDSVARIFQAKGIEDACTLAE